MGACTREHAAVQRADRQLCAWTAAGLEAVDHPLRLSGLNCRLDHTVWCHQSESDTSWTDSPGRCSDWFHRGRGSEHLDVHLSSERVRNPDSRWQERSESNPFRINRCLTMNPSTWKSGGGAPNGPQSALDTAAFGLTAAATAPHTANDVPPRRSIVRHVALRHPPDRNVRARPRSRPHRTAAMGAPSPGSGRRTLKHLPTGLCSCVPKRGDPLDVCGGLARVHGSHEGLHALHGPACVTVTAINRG